MTDFGDSMNGVYAEGVAELPTGLAILENVPSITTTTLWNVGRVQNTMLGGSKQFKQARRRYNKANKLGALDGRSISDFMDPNAGRGGFVRQGFSNTFRPSRFRRLTRAAAIDPSAYDPSAKMYSPFQLARIGNALISGNMKDLPIVGKHLPVTKATQAQRAIATKLGMELADDTPAFSSGLLGRMGTNARLASMTPKKFDKIRAGLASSLDDIAGGPGKMVGSVATATEARMAVTAGVRSQIGGKIMGYMDVATEYSRGGMTAAQSYADDLAKLGNQAAKRGADLALKQAAKPGGSAMLKIAPKLGVASRALGPLGTALMVKDAFKLVGKGVGALVKTGLEAGQSIMGSIDKPLMGMGYRDNSVAATSRQRGVMAIQNSQLNARSILGSEAAGLHAHFG